MTESTASDTAKQAPQPSFWEDAIDIFFSPAGVFRRREDKSVWPPMLFVALSIGIIFFVTFNTIEPIFDAEFNRAMAQAAKAGRPAAPPEMMDKIRGYSTMGTRYGISVIMLVTMFVLGFVSWIVGKLVGAKQTFHAALVVAAWSYFPRVLGAVLGGVQGLLMDQEKLNSQLALSIGPARFFDPDTTNPLLYQVLGRFDLITIWVTVLLAIGLYVTSKAPKGQTHGITKAQAAAFGVLIWIIGALPVLRQAYVAM